MENILIKKIDIELWNESWSRNMWGQIEEIQRLSSIEGDEYTMKLLLQREKEAFKKSVYRWTNSLPPTHVSKEIIRLFKENNIEQSPFDLTYAIGKGRKILGYGGKKTIMQWEHMQPNELVFEEYVKCKSKKELRKLMDEHIGCCWITSEENERLDKAGFRSKRPGGWQPCYEQVNIDVVKYCSETNNTSNI
jgi:hypothetical protein